MGEHGVIDPSRPPDQHISVTMGALAGVLATLGFMVVHGLWILDIWDMTGPMVFSGALSGFAIAWSYNTAVAKHSTSRWLGYNGLITALLVLLGIASFVILEPRFTMAETMAMGDDALGELMPPTVPLMIGAAVAGTAALWTAFGRRRGALLPILLAQVLVVFFAGHQVAMLGLVEETGELIGFYSEFVALALYLAAAYAGGVLLLERARRSLVGEESQGATATTPARRP